MENEIKKTTFKPKINKSKPKNLKEKRVVKPYREISEDQEENEEEQEEKPAE